MTSSLKDLVEIVRQSRERTANVFPLPSIDDCIDYAITEAGEYLDAVLRGKRAGDKRNNDKRHDRRSEWGQCGYMIASALIQMDDALPLQMVWDDGSVHGTFFWLCLYQMEHDGGCVVDALNNYAISCQSNGWDATELLRETCAAFEAKHLPKKPVYPVLTEEEAAAQGEVATLKILDYEIPLDGCQAHSCLIRTPHGQAVNGPCRCLDHIDRTYALLVRKELHDRGYPK